MINYFSDASGSGNVTCFWFVRKSQEVVDGGADDKKAVLDEITESKDEEKAAKNDDAANADSDSKSSQLAVGSSTSQEENSAEVTSNSQKEDTTLSVCNGVVEEHNKSDELEINEQHNNNASDNASEFVENDNSKNVLGNVEIAKEVNLVQDDKDDALVNCHVEDSTHLTEVTLTEPTKDVVVAKDDPKEEEPPTVDSTEDPLKEDQSKGEEDVTNEGQVEESDFTSDHLSALDDSSVDNPPTAPLPNNKGADSSKPDESEEKRDSVRDGKTLSPKNVEVELEKGSDHDAGVDVAPELPDLATIQEVDNEEDAEKKSDQPRSTPASPVLEKIMNVFKGTSQSYNLKNGKASSSVDAPISSEQMNGHASETDEVFETKDNQELKETGK